MFKKVQALHSGLQTEEGSQDTGCFLLHWEIKLSHKGLELVYNGKTDDCRK